MGKDTMPLRVSRRIRSRHRAPRSVRTSVRRKTLIVSISKPSEKSKASQGWSIKIATGVLQRNKDRKTFIPVSEAPLVHVAARVFPSLSSRQGSSYTEPGPGTTGYPGDTTFNKSGLRPKIKRPSTGVPGALLSLSSIFGRIKPRFVALFLPFLGQYLVPRGFEFLFHRHQRFDSDALDPGTMNMNMNRQARKTSTSKHQSIKAKDGSSLG